MGLLRNLLHRKRTPRPGRWLHISERDMPDADDRALHERIINAASRGQGVLIGLDPIGGDISLGDRHFNSLEEATEEIKALP